MLAVLVNGVIIISDIPDEAILPSLSSVAIAKITNGSAVALRAFNTVGAENVITFSNFFTVRVSAVGTCTNKFPEVFKIENVVIFFILRYVKSPPHTRVRQNSLNNRQAEIRERHFLCVQVHAQTQSSEPQRLFRYVF